MLAIITSIAGLAGLVLTIGLLTWQTRAAVRQAEIANAIAGTSVLFNCTTSLREVLTLFVDDPGLRTYFYDGTPSPAESHERARVLTIAEMLADTLEDGLVAHRLVPASEEEENWLDYCRWLRASSPVLDETIRRHNGWWPQLNGVEPATIPASQEHEVLAGN